MLDDMTELEVIRKDAIRLATVVVNLSKKYQPFHARARDLGYRALSAREPWELERVCHELRKVYRKLLELEFSRVTPEDEGTIGIRPSGTDRGREMDDPDHEPEP
jgi:hypothetical protein